MADEQQLQQSKATRSLTVGLLVIAALSVVLTACSTDGAEPIIVPTRIVLPSPALPMPDATATAVQARSLIEELDLRLTLLGYTPTATISDQEFWATVTAIPGFFATITAMEPTVAAFNTAFWQGFMTGQTSTMSMDAVWQRMTDVPAHVWLTAASIPEPTLTAYAEGSAEQP